MRIRLAFLTALIAFAPQETKAWEASTTAPTLHRIGLSSLSHPVRGSALEPSLITVPYSEDNAISIGEGIDLITGRRKLRQCVSYISVKRTALNDKDTSFSEVTDVIGGSW